MKELENEAVEASRSNELLDRLLKHANLSDAERIMFQIRVRCGHCGKLNTMLDEVLSFTCWKCKAENKRAV